MFKKSKFLLVMFALIMSIMSCKRLHDDSIPQFTVTYDANGHSTAPDSITVDEGYILTEEDLPELEETGFMFLGWKLGDEFISAGKEVTADITLKAEWEEIETYTVTFDANGHGTAPEPITGKRKGEKITLPAALEVNGYSFDNWSDGTNTYAAGATYTVTGNVTIKATWKGWITVATPTFSITDSSIDYGDTVAITCTTTDANIYYTIDGTVPTTSNTKYTSPIKILAATTIKAIAIKAGMNPSEIASAEYTIKTYTITIDTDGHGTAPAPITGKHKGETITLPAALEANGYSFDNWTDGTNTYAAGVTYTVTGNVTIKATWKGWNTISTPTFSVTDSAIDYGDTVAITCTTTDADIYYTTDGIVPTTSSTKYTAPITITAASTIKAIAIKAGMNNSAVAEKSYTIKTYTVTFDADGHGTAPEAITGKHKGETVTLPVALTTTGFTFNKWNDGTADYDAGATYTVNENVTLKAIWIEWNTVAAPTFSKPAGEVDYGNKVTIACATPDADIYYTTDGTAPTANSTKYANEEIQITAATIIKAIAVKSGMNDSSVTSAAYTIKLYTVTFDANGHGTAPDAMKGYKGQTITLPAAPTEAGWGFVNWNDGTTDYAAEANYTVTGDITIKAVWKEIKNLTNFTVICVASGTVKLTWTNPTDADFAKVVITYGTDGKVEVLKTAIPNNEATVAGLTNGTEYEFTVKAYDEGGNVSSGVNKIGTVYYATNNGGLEGYTNQTQGEVIKETWMDTTSGNIKIGSNTIAKTSEVVVVPAGTVAKINMTSSDAKGDLFTSSRKVKLSPFVMSQYPVTRGMFKAVMGDYYNNINDNQATPTGTEDENPINYVNWFDAIVFCNKLSKMCGLDPVYSYDFSTDGSGKMTNPDYWFNDTTNLSASVPTSDSDTNYSNWKDKVEINLKANGYRLPTEAEWEFCARGGIPNAEDWGYTYSGSNTVTEVAWYIENSDNSGTNIVGCMNKANKLGLYDMSGNVGEWCDDNYNIFTTVDDDKYKDSECYVKDPLVVSESSFRGLRGSSWGYDVNYCEVCYRWCYNFPYYRTSLFGFRLVRSTESN